METLLIHEDHFNSSNASFFNDLCDMLKKEGVTIYSGPKLDKKVSRFRHFLDFYTIPSISADVWTAGRKNYEARVRIA
jgi:hypothetical protein